MKKSQLIEIIKEEIRNVLTETWKSSLRKNYDDDYDQFVQYDEIYGIAKRLGFESAEEAWEANPIIQGSTDPKDLKIVGEASFPHASEFKGAKEIIRKNVINGFIEAIRDALKKHKPVINTGLDEFEKLNDTEFEQVRADAEKNGWELVQFDDNYQTTSYSMKKKSNINEFITSGNELDILTNAARDINSKVFSGRGDFNAMTYQLTVRDTTDEVLKKLETNTEIREKGRGFGADDDEAREFYQLPGYNVAISFDQYKMSRGTTIQFLSFDGEFPKSQGMF